ncbi:hypothetical protein C5167_011985 [Papaver somniferum]|uniref:Uncharacterized protein n=1 Tax=Papaver somniferum TaxID=3469 RepID=A0A4Y7J0E3_PAPSO|nr:hypothetical protein C5167_011985 [Papaver somniferum]
MFTYKSDMKEDVLISYISFFRASEYFDNHPIKNVVGEDGEEIDWEGKIDDGWLKEINCLEWESFAFYPSPLIVLVFERYNSSISGLNVTMPIDY